VVYCFVTKESIGLLIVIISSSDCHLFTALKQSLGDVKTVALQRLSIQDTACWQQGLSKVPTMMWWIFQLQREHL